VASEKAETHPSPKALRMGHPARAAARHGVGSDWLVASEKAETHPSPKALRMGHPARAAARLGVGSAG
jgi:hypothetical protein